MSKTCQRERERENDQIQYFIIASTKASTNCDEGQQFPSRVRVGLFCIS